MEYILVWALFGIATAIAAVGKKRTFFGWFLLGVFLGPFGLLFVLLLPKIDETGPVSSARPEMKRCPSCAEPIRFEAVKCRFCGHEYDRALVEREIEELRESGAIQCPNCMRWDTYLATIEGGGIGNWCPHCQKSIQAMSREPIAMGAGR